MVRFGGKHEIIQASLKTQSVFEQFTILRLTSANAKKMIPVSPTGLTPSATTTKNPLLILAVFSIPPVLLKLLLCFQTTFWINPKNVSSVLSFSPYNQFVDDFNNSVLDRFTGAKRTYFSSDEVESDMDGIPVKSTLSQLRIS
jgi:hypothetical protein